MKVKEALQLLDELFPFDLAFEGDNVGLQCGDPESEVKNIVLSLDPLLEAIEFALAEEANLLITHHPLIFVPLRKIVSSPVLVRAIKADLNVVSLHTNLDVAFGGVNDQLVFRLGFEGIRVLEEKGEGSIARWGELNPPRTLQQLALEVAEKLETPVRFLGKPDKLVSKVVTCGGKGESLIPLVKEKGADVFITGDVGYHAALRALELGLNLIDATHEATEKVVLPALKDKLEKKLSLLGWQGKIKIFSGDTLSWLEVK